MKAVLKVILEIVLGAVCFLSLCFVLFWFSFFVANVVENIQIDETLAGVVIVFLFITICWMIGSDVLNFIKRLF